MKRLNLLALIVLIVAIPSMSIWAGGVTEDQQEVKQMVIGYASIVRSLDPASQICNEEGSLEQNLYDNLLTYDRNDFSKLAPSLAKDWDISSDGTEYTFYLREGAKFSTGNEVTADDVVFSFRRGLRINHPNYPGIDEYLLDDLDAAIKKIDKYTVQMTLKRPFMAFGTLLTNSHCGVIDSKTLKENVSDDDPEGVKYLDDHSLGSGPFMLEEWKRNEYIKLVRNPNYWGIKENYFRVPKYDVLIDRNIPEASVQKMMLDRGEIQMAMNLTGEMIDEYAKNTDFRIDMVPIWIGTGILMNPAKDIFSDPKVRKAVRYAIDTETIIEDILRGYAIPMDRPIFQPFPASLKDGEERLYDYDVAKAKELMGQSDYPDGGEFTIVIGTGGGFGAPWEVIVQKELADLEKIGLKGKIEQYDWSVVDEKTTSGDYEALQFWTGLFIDEVAGNSVTHAHSTKSFYLRVLPDYVNPEIDRLCDEADAEQDPATREKLYRQMALEHFEDGPYAWVGQKLQPFVFPKNVKGFDTYSSLYNIDFSVFYYED